MKSPWIAGLRSVALTVPDLAAAEVFYTQTWLLSVAHRAPGVLYLRGSGADHHLLALHAAPGTPQILKVTLRARSADALQAIALAVPAAGGVIETAVSAAADPAGGQALVLRDAGGRRIEVVHGDAPRSADLPPPRDQPLRLAHAVLNCHAIATTQAFFEQALGFVLADRTRIMAFMNCDADHHSIALGDTDNDALNHIAFLMPTLDAVMRGGGRLKDAGLPPQWGPGRHGPGDNTFNYFVDPFGIVIEYTAEVEQIDDSYQPGSPGDWTWPPGRIDQWGLGTAPTDALKQAQRRVLFAPHLPA
jgi:catechol 2,3-dioxygenase